MNLENTIDDKNSSRPNAAAFASPKTHAELEPETEPEPATGNSTSIGSPSRDRSPLGAGDSYLVEDLLPPDLAAVAFDRLREEVAWGAMTHRGGDVPRLVAVEGEIGEDGSRPIYRHPADTAPPLRAFTPTTSLIRTYVERQLQHQVNHVLIQLYRSGADCISEHSDKTVDITRGSSVVNVSLGARRVMVLRGKRVGRGERAEVEAEPEPEPETDAIVENGVTAAAEASTTPPIFAAAPPRPTQRILLLHNSMFVLGPNTNAEFLHGIPTDKRPLQRKSSPERAYGGARISLTFRWVGTFLDVSGGWIWGQGAKGRGLADAGRVLRVGGGQREAEVEGEDEEKRAKEQAERLLWAFGIENRESVFDWEKWYGDGFDVVDFGGI